MPNSNTIMKAGVVGWPVNHSLSPRLHSYWLKQHNINGTYAALPIEPENLADFIKYLPKELGARGVNLTVPHKEAALKCVNHLDPLAAKVGAVNTVLVRPDGTTEGRNTDVFGFAENLRSAGFQAGGKAVILGAGGAARAALVALIEMGMTDIHILNRTIQRAEELAKEFTNPSVKIAAHEWNDASALEGASLLVNATSLGLKGQPPLELPLDNLPREAWVTDMVYVPLKTDLLVRAEARGNKIVDGLGMLLHQARPAFQAFFGVDPQVTDELRQFVLSGA